MVNFALSMSYPWQGPCDWPPGWCMVSLSKRFRATKDLGRHVSNLPMHISPIIDPKTPRIFFSDLVYTVHLSQRHVFFVSRTGFSLDSSIFFFNLKGTVDERNPANQLRLVVYPIIYKVPCILSVVSRISEPSTVPPTFSDFDQNDQHGNLPPSNSPLFGTTDSAFFPPPKVIFWKAPSVQILVRWSWSQSFSKKDSECGQCCGGRGNPWFMGHVAEPSWLQFSQFFYRIKIPGFVSKLFYAFHKSVFCERVGSLPTELRQLHDFGYMDGYPKWWFIYWFRKKQIWVHEKPFNSGDTPGFPIQKGNVTVLGRACPAFVFVVRSPSRNQVSRPGYGSNLTCFANDVGWLKIFSLESKGTLLRRSPAPY